eukprot:727978_1
MDAPPLDPLKNTEPENINYGAPPTQKQPRDKQYCPTPRDWTFQWVSSPTAQQAHIPATSPPRINDPVLLRNALTGIAYYADKLDSLHSTKRTLPTQSCNCCRRKSAN